MIDRVRSHIGRSQPADPRVDEVLERVAELEQIADGHERVLHDAVGDLADRLAALERRIRALEDAV